jgi:hypothetical protein
VAGRQKTEAPITPTADRQPARLGNFTAPLLRKIAAPLTIAAKSARARDRFRLVRQSVQRN